MTDNTDQIRPGEKATASGQYQEISPDGVEGREVTVVRGEPLPPTTQPGATYRLVDRTRNKSGQG